MWVIVDVADKWITCTEALDGILEEDLSARRLVGIQMACAPGMVVGVVTHNEDFTFAVKVEVGKAGMAVL